MTKTSTNLTEPDITVAFDYGGSLTKIIFAGQDRQVRLLYMEPEVVSVPRESILGYARDQLGSADPQNTAWVAFRNDYRAVGYLAKQRFHANAGLSELKYERALHKTLAALWVIKEKQKLPGNFTVAIAALLPPGEYEDRSRFERVLREALADYQTPTGRMSVELLVFNCKPEGGGIYLMHNKKAGSGIKERVCAIAMIGYRNASLLVAQRGDVAPGKMSDLGFIRMVEKVLVKTSGQTAERLTPAIVTAGSEFKVAPLMRLARSTSREGRAEEVQQMLLAIKEARPEYVRSLTSWLDENLPPDCDELVFCGGTATYFKKELNQYYDRLPIIWN
ncbi:ParM/StbA family protein, partial [Planktothrix sp.]|uniref:ParM/StbA family protein n=1 Tax=Planktothrix sp. TaxID=3088171 RepID=UPI0038D50FC2